MPFGFNLHTRFRAQDINYGLEEAQIEATEFAVALSATQSCNFLSASR